MSFIRTSFQNRSFARRARGIRALSSAFLVLGVSVQSAFAIDETHDTVRHGSVKQDVIKSQDATRSSPGPIVITRFGASPTASNGDWSALYEKLKPSIPLVFTQGGVCSGAVVTQELILTAGHCVSKVRTVSISWSDSPKVAVPVKIVAFNTDHDFALLRLNEPTKRIPIPLRPKDQPLKEGAPIATIGHPTTGKPYHNPPIDLDTTYLISSGVISKVNETDFITDLSLSPGNSGGPVFDQEGRIIGVVSRKRVDRFVGQIGYVGSFKQARELIEAQQSGKEPEPRPFFDALPSVLTEFSYTWNSVLADRPGLEKGHFNLGLSVDLFDRIRLTGSTSVFDKDATVSSYGAGWKFEMVFPNRSTLWITPTFERWVHDFGLLGSQSGLGASLSIFGGAMPIGLKVTALKVGADLRWLWTLQLVGALF